MRSCLLIDFLSGFPGGLLDAVVAAHCEKCQSCRARLAGREEARGLLTGEGAAALSESLRERIVRAAVGAAGGAAQAAPRPAVRPAGLRAWALTVAAAVVIISAGLWLWRQAGPGTPAPAERFEIDRVKVRGGAATAYIYQPRGSDTIFVWAEKNP